MSIRTKFILILAFSLSAMALGTSLAVHFFALKETETSFPNIAAAHMDRVEDLIRSGFAVGSEAAKTLANLPEAANEALLKENGGPDAAAKAALLRRLESLHAVVPGVEAAFCGYKNGMAVMFPDGSASTEGGGTTEDPSEADVRKRTWYSDAVLGTAQTSVTDAYISDASKSLAATVAHKIKNAQGETIGAAAVSVSLASLTDTLRDIQLGSGGYLVILDAQNRVILDPKAQENLLRDASATHDEALGALSRLPSGVHTVTREGAEYFAYIRSLAMPHWKVAILMDTKALFNPVDNLTLHTALIVLAALCVAFGLGSLLAMGATRPLRALIRQSTALANGNIEALEGIPGRGPDITVLHSNFGRLTGRIMLLLQAEKERTDAAETFTSRTAESKQETARLEQSLRETHRAERRKIAETLVPVASDLAAAVETLSAKSQAARTQAETQLHAADETRAAIVNTLSDAALYARQATETEANANSSLSLANEIGARIEETARGLDSTKNAVFILAGNLETMKADIDDMAEMATSARELAESANLLGFNVSLDASSTGSDTKTLSGIVEKIQAIAENAMTVAGTVDAVTASLEQQHASQAQTLHKSLSALKRASSGNADAGKAAAAALAGTTTTAEQFRVLATALEGAVHNGHSHVEQADELLRASRGVADLLQKMDGPVMALTTLSARLATAAEDWDSEKQLD